MLGWQASVYVLRSRYVHNLRGRMRSWACTVRIDMIPEKRIRGCPRELNTDTHIRHGELDLRLLRDRLQLTNVIHTLMHTLLT